MMVNDHTLNFSDATDIQIANATSLDDESIHLSIQVVDLTSNIEHSMEGSSVESHTPQTDVDLWNSGAMETLLGEKHGTPPSCTTSSSTSCAALSGTDPSCTVPLHTAPSSHLCTLLEDHESMESECDVDFGEQLNFPPSSSSAADLARSYASPPRSALDRSAPVRSAPAHTATAHTATAHTAPTHTAPTHTVPSRLDQSAADNNFWTAFGDNRSLESEDEEIFGGRSNTPSSRSSVKKVPKSKPKTIAHSFRRTKSLKEKLLEKKIDWQREKFEKQQKLQFEMMEKFEKSKQKRHDEKRS